jgi:hypothetical protein
MFVHVWAEGRLWALALSTIYRERVWKNSWETTALARKREARLLGPIDALAGTWAVSDMTGQVTYLALGELAERRIPHPDLIAALDDAADRRAHDVGRAPRPARTRCAPSRPDLRRAESPAVDPVASPTLPSPPEAPVLPGPPPASIGAAETAGATDTIQLDFGLSSVPSGTRRRRFPLD